MTYPSPIVISDPMRLENRPAFVTLLMDSNSAKYVAWSDRNAEMGGIRLGLTLERPPIPAPTSGWAPWPRTIYERGVPGVVASSGLDMLLYFNDPSLGVIYRLDCSSTFGNEPSVLIKGQGRVSAMAVDETNLYWLSETNSTVNKLNLGTGDVTVVSQGIPNLFGMCVDETNIYFSQKFDSGSIFLAPILSGGPHPLLSNGTNRARYLVSDGSYVYWIEDGGTLSKVEIATGTPTVLVPSVGEPGQITQVGAYIYYLDRGTPANNYTDGKMSRVPKAGGSSSDLLLGIDRPLGLVAGPLVLIGAHHIYVACEGYDSSSGQVLAVYHP